MIPILFTATNLILGSYLIIYTLKSDIEINQLFILMGVCLLSDLLDGKMARVFKKSGELGKQLDSLADLVSFGLFPTILLYEYLQSHAPIGGVCVAILPVFYLIAAWYRLAKFNTLEPSVNFIGLPTPAAAICVTSIYALAVQTNTNLWIIISSSAIILAVAMVSKKMHVLGLKGLSVSVQFYPFILINVLFDSMCLYILGLGGLVFVVVIYIISGYVLVLAKDKSNQGENAGYFHDL
ncbi:MAG: CDP-alcohol phosphatidyltransferase family protein [Flavobacteriales bacterium]|nr:CDP-alcohol phosphatidyltransferase family protein [Flavobacteriales bacterium]